MFGHSRRQTVLQPVVNKESLSGPYHHFLDFKISGNIFLFCLYYFCCGLL